MGGSLILKSILMRRDSVELVSFADCRTLKSRRRCGREKETDSCKHLERRAWEEGEVEEEVKVEVDGGDK